MRFLITGATSMIGLALEKELLERGHEIVAVARRESDELKALARQGCVQTILCEMCDYKSLSSFVAEPVDVAVLLAWNGTRGQARNDVELHRQNTEYNLSLLPELFKLKCKKVITAGSQAEYGPHSERITENSECRPNTEYGKAKLAFYKKAEELCAEHGVICIEPRFFSLYGPNDYKDTLVSSTLRKMIAEEECQLTQGVQMWDYLYIDDACDALATLCERKDIPCGVYNFGSGDVRTLKDYILEMNEITGGNGILSFGAIPYPSTGMVSLWPDVSKLKEAINWTPKVKFGEGIKSILNSMNKDGII